MELDEITTERRMMEKSNLSTVSRSTQGEKESVGKKVHDNVISQKSNEENVWRMWE